MSLINGEDIGIGFPVVESDGSWKVRSLAYSLRYSSRFSSLSDALPSVALRCSSGVLLETERNDREGKLTLHSICLLAHYL